MVRRRQAAEKSYCPLIDLGDSRCDATFTLSNVDKAMRLCLREHHSCAIYHQLSIEPKRSRQATVAPHTPGTHCASTG